MLMRTGEVMAPVLLITTKTMVTLATVILVMEAVMTVLILLPQPMLCLKQSLQ